MKMSVNQVSNLFTNLWEIPNAFYLTRREQYNFTQFSFSLNELLQGNTILFTEWIKLPPKQTNPSLYSLVTIKQIARFLVSESWNLAQLCITDWGWNVCWLENRKLQTAENVQFNHFWCSPSWAGLRIMMSVSRSNQPCITWLITVDITNSVY